MQADCRQPRMPGIMHAQAQPPRLHSLRQRSAAVLALLCLLSRPASPSEVPSGWPDWNHFRQRFIQADGRVSDITFGGKTTSEGQSYALFFALVANQRPEFDTILAWSANNLAAGGLDRVLPAYLWGQRADGTWGVKDGNSAADADLWMAYTLLEAARLWSAPQYGKTGRRLLELIAVREVAQTGSAGPVLLPGPVGFVLNGGRFRIDPSYLPGFMFRYLAEADRGGPWNGVWETYQRMAPDVFSAGVAPDLFVIDAAGRVLPDTEAAPSGSYDAIRVYLWAGMSGAAGADLVRRLAPYAVLTRRLGAPPERVDPRNGVAIPSSYFPLGYSGAVLPFLAALGEHDQVEAQLARLRQGDLEAQAGKASNYYDQVLILFGKGWLERRYAFDAQGHLQPDWALAAPDRFRLRSGDPGRPP